MSELKVTGTITSIEDVKSGTSQKSGEEWARINFVLETEGEFPKSVYFTLFGVDKVDRFVQYNKVGDRVEVSFDLRSRKYDGKWFNDFNAWKVWTLKGEGATQTAPQEELVEEDGDDLPF